MELTPRKSKTPEKLTLNKNASRRLCKWVTEHKTTPTQVVDSICSQVETISELIIQLAHYTEAKRNAAVAALLQLPRILTGNPIPDIFSITNHILMEPISQYMSVAAAVAGAIAPALVESSLSISVIVYLEGVYHHHSLSSRDVAIISSAQIAKQAALDED